MDELSGLIARYAESDGMHPTALSRAFLYRSTRPTEPIHTLYQPALCIIAQGSKHVMLGEEIVAYDAAHYLVVSVDLPIAGQIVEASARKPYLALRLDLDPAMLSALILEAGGARADNAAPGPGLVRSRMTPELLDGITRLLRLLDRPNDIPMLAPLIEREILYRALQGEQAARLRQIAQADSHLVQINRAIAWIKHHYAEPFSIDAVAAEARMSPSALHQHFKTVTTLSPLQYQKRLRLQEARRLILNQAVDAATAGHNVGYESPSQFSREYSRLFGAPPMRDIARLRASPDFALAAAG